MNLEAQKMRFENIDECFSVLKKNRRNSNAIHTIEKNLKEVFNQNFTITIVESKYTDAFLVMSIYPEMATIDKIVNAVVNEQSTHILNEIWAKNDSWIIEIDRRVLDDSVFSISNRECTALLLHEIGHTVRSNSIPTRLGRVLKYEFANMDSSIKAIFRSDRFKSILSLPVADACSLATSDKGLKEEIAADNYAKNLGYGMELSSILGKFTNTNNPDDSVKKVTRFSEEVVRNFKDRRAKLNQRNLDIMLAKIPSPYVGSILRYMRNTYTEGSKDTSMTDDIFMESVCKSANDIVDSYYTEFFFSKKKLKRIPEYDLDYITVETDSIRTNDDKLLLLSYTRSKIDTIQYYIDILKSEKYSKKYEVPHSMEYLVAYKSKLEQCVNKILAKKIEPKNYHLTITYPEGYEG